MDLVPPPPVVRLPRPWSLRPAGAAPGWLARHAAVPVAQVTLSRVARDEVRHCYPYGVRDLLVRVAPVNLALVGDLLRVLGDRLLAADPACRRLLMVADPDDRDLLARYQAGGFRHVVDADLAGGTVALLVREPRCSVPRHGG